MLGEISNGVFRSKGRAKCTACVRIEGSGDQDMSLTVRSVYSINSSASSVVSKVVTKRKKSRQRNEVVTKGSEQVCFVSECGVSGSKKEDCPD